MDIKFDIDTRDLIDRLSKAAGGDLAFATSVALTETAKIAKTNVQAEMRRVFDRPKDYTINSVRVEASTKTKLYAFVKLADVTGSKSLPAAKYLQPEIEGGERRNKALELAVLQIAAQQKVVRLKGVLTGDVQFVPGEGAKLDQYGNISRAFANQMLSGLRAWSQEGFSANETTKSRARRKKTGKDFVFFLGMVKGTFGVYQRFQFAGGSAVRPVFVAVRRPHYKIRLRFIEVIQNTWIDEFPYQFGKAVDRVLKNPRG
jgi:hypothetical protein